jgi:hypothetical protein
MNVLNLKESQNSLISRLKYLRSHSPDGVILDRCNKLMICIQKNIDSYDTYKKFDNQIDQINMELGDVLKDYDPFDDDLDDIENDSDEDDEELQWWELDSPKEKKWVIRFSLPEETKSFDIIPTESMYKITKRLDLYDRIRKKSIPKEISVQLKQTLLEFMKYCNKFMNVEKWFHMKQYIQKRDLRELYDDFKCSRINQQLNECYTDSEDVKIDIDIDNIDSLHYISEINKKVDDLQHSTILKFAIMYRIENPYFHMNSTSVILNKQTFLFDIIDEIRDLYDMIITSEMNFYRTNLFKMLLEIDIEEILDV